jgi:uncharacterized metal-binding protein YceD (DUF177 family)
VSTPELSRIVRVEHVGEGLDYRVEASEAERAAVAARLSVVSVGKLVCIFDLQRARAGVVPATGTLSAEVVQTCVVSLEPFATVVGEDFEVNFVPAGTETDELDLEAVDEVPYADGVIDLGEAATEQLALALDPFPRKPGAELPDAAAGEAEGPFSVLRGFKKPE